MIDLRIPLIRVSTAILLLMLALSAPQKSFAQAQQPANPSPYAEAVTKLALLINQGRYDEVIGQTTEMLAQPEAPAAPLQYLRGYAEYRICWLGASEQDLTPLQDFSLNPNWPAASTLVQKIEALRALCPPKVHEIRDGGDVIFRVYCDEDNDWSAAIIKLLPEAAKIGNDMFGVRLLETPVFIFKTNERYTAFYKLRFDKTPGSWVWASGSLGLFMFCETDPTGKKPAEDTTGDYFRGTVAHEYTHTLIGRAIGTALLPRWMNEGLANVAGSKLAKEDLNKNDAKMKALFAAKALLSLDELNDTARFNDAVERMLSLKKVEAGKDAASAAAEAKPQGDAYAQALHMMRCLLEIGKKEDILRFLTFFTETRDLDGSFRDVYAMSVPDFYAAWQLKNGVIPAGK